MIHIIVYLAGGRDGAFLLRDAQGGSRLDTILAPGVEAIDILHAYAVHGSDGVDGLPALDRMIKYIISLLVRRKDYLLFVRLGIDGRAR